MFWWRIEPQCLALWWLWETDLCVCVSLWWGAGSRRTPPPSATVPLTHFSWSSTRTRLELTPWVFGPEKKQMLRDFHRNSALSSALNCLILPYFSPKKIYQAPVLSKSMHLIISHVFSILGLICTYRVERLTFMSYPPPTEVNGVFDSSESRIWLTLPNYCISNGNWNLEHFFKQTETLFIFKTFHLHFALILHNNERHSVTTSRNTVTCIYCPQNKHLPNAL